MLWFDVGYKRYTTMGDFSQNYRKLWFDVGYKRYTTDEQKDNRRDSCGLM